jgi:hypothetical protein
VIFVDAAVVEQQPQPVVVEVAVTAVSATPAAGHAAPPEL